MAFPASPSNNQVHKEGTRSFVYDSTLGVWDQVKEINRALVPSTAGSGVPLSAPSLTVDSMVMTPRATEHPDVTIAGTMYYNNADSSLYVSTGVSWLRVSNNLTATGGTKTTHGIYTVHSFTSGTTTWTPDIAGNVDILVVAGGGGAGGRFHAGGGGAGGVRQISLHPVTAIAYTITVGGGGSAYSNSSNNYQSSNASNSKIDWASGTDIEATRGGAGRGTVTTLSPTPPQSGGSGSGGGSGSLTGASGNAGGYSPVEGYGGGNGSTAWYYTSGASGGAGGAGSSSGGYSQAWGAPGIYNYYQTGSSGSTDGVHKFAGAGHGTGFSGQPFENSNNNYGGGKSGTQNGVYGNCNAIANTGGGGGAGSFWAQGTYYFNGGSGIVTIRWPTP